MHPFNECESNIDNIDIEKTDLKLSEFLNSTFQRNIEYANLEYRQANANPYHYIRCVTVSVIVRFNKCFSHGDVHVKKIMRDLSLTSLTSVLPPDLESKKQISVRGAKSDHYGSC